MTIMRRVRYMYNLPALLRHNEVTMRNIIRCRKSAQRGWRQMAARFWQRSKRRRLVAEEVQARITKQSDIIIH